MITGILAWGRPGRMGPYPVSSLIFVVAYQMYINQPIKNQSTNFTNMRDK